MASSPNGIINYTFPGVLHYLQMEWRRYEKEKTEWEIERTDLKTRLSFLEGERRGIENLKVDLMRRVKMLEYALRQERIKYLQLQQKVNNNEINIIDNTDNKSESITSNSGLLNRLNKDRSISKSPASIKNEEANSINPSPTPMIGYWNPSPNSTNSLNDIRNYKRSNDSSSTLNSLNNSGLQKSIKATVYTPINKDKNFKSGVANSINNNINNNDQGNTNNNTNINGNSDHGIFIKKKAQKKIVLLLEMNHLDTVRSLSFHHTDKLLLSCSDDGTAKLWNLEFLGNTKKNMVDIDPIYTYRGHMGPVLSVDMSENVCYTGGLDSTIRSWKIPAKNIELYSKYDPSIKQHTFEGHTDAVWCVKSHPLRDHYHLLASGSSDGTVKLWDTESYDLKSTLDYNGLLSNRSKEIESNPTYLDWLNIDLSKMIVSYQNSIVKLFDIETGSEYMKLPSAETYDNTLATQINQVLSHPTMPLIITAHEDRYIRFFDVKSGECINSMTAHLDGVTSLSIHPSGLTFASGGHDSSIRIWDISSKNCIQEMSSHRKKFDEGVWCVKYHPILSNILASGGGDSTCKIYSIDQPF
ncbi:WD40 repeat-like protein [Neocallimastix californiae]|uniref:WD40 repeat-like protein n=1 Tax=Neocallimastix californiae TaxID=1754190 RepID=A0A1Y2F0F1_9FUNG|nr:WD40 repeat-like protein [Neocallimastix californiae]|eukprot:ORY76836.1 WD40 repeat-like protein [Neocallimastix californiae]